MCLSTAALLWRHIIEKDQQILTEIKSSLQHPDVSPHTTGSGAAANNNALPDNAMRNDRRRNLDQQQGEVGLMEKESKLETSSGRNSLEKRRKAVLNEQGHNVLTADRRTQLAVTGSALAFLYKFPTEKAEL